MKKVYAVIALLILSSCIYVQDLNYLWDKGFVDPRLEGHWLGGNDKLKDVMTDLDVTLEKDQFRIKTILDRKKHDFFVRSYKMIADKRPEHRLLIIRPVVSKHGVDTPLYYGAIMKYDITDDTLQTYSLDNAKAYPYIQQYYPALVDTLLNERVKQVQIMAAGPRVLFALTNMPDDFWVVTMVYKKQKQ